MTDSGHGCLQEMSEMVHVLFKLSSITVCGEIVQEGITIYLEILLDEALIETEAVAVIHSHFVSAGQQRAIHPLLHFLPA